ncbi:hypothetical protein ABPG72_018552 [Tetrahymena utriculariae]
MFKLLQSSKKKLHFNLSNIQQQRAQGLKVTPFNFTNEKTSFLKHQLLFKNKYCFSQSQHDEKDQYRSFENYGRFNFQDRAEQNIFLIVGSIFIALAFGQKYINQQKPQGVQHIEKYKKEKDQIQKLEYAYDLIELQKSFTLEELKYLEGEVSENNILLLSIIQSQIAANLLSQPEKLGYLKVDLKEQNQDQLNEGQDYVQKSFDNLCQVIKNNQQNNIKQFQNLSKYNKTIHEILTRIIVDVLINLKCTQNFNQKNQFLNILKENTKLYPEFAYKLKQFY